MLRWAGLLCCCLCLCCCLSCDSIQRQPRLLRRLLRCLRLRTKSEVVDSSKERRCWRCERRRRPWRLERQVSAADAGVAVAAHTRCVRRRRRRRRWGRSISLEKPSVRAEVNACHTRRIRNVRHSLQLQKDVRKIDATWSEWARRVPSCCYCCLRAVPGRTGAPGGHLPAQRTVPQALNCGTPWLDTEIDKAPEEEEDAAAVWLCCCPSSSWCCCCCYCCVVWKGVARGGGGWRLLKIDGHWKVLTSVKGRLSDQVGSEPTRTGSELFVIVASRMFLTVRVWPHFARREVKVQPVRNEIAGQEVTVMMTATACSLDFLSATELINMTMTKVNCVFPRGTRHTELEKGQDIGASSLFICWINRKKQNE